MANTEAKTNWKDYIPDSQGIRYRINQLEDGTYQIIDVSNYTVIGDKVTAEALNTLGQIINNKANPEDIPEVKIDQIHDTNGTLYRPDTTLKVDSQMGTVRDIYVGNSTGTLVPQVAGGNAIALGIMAKVRGSNSVAGNMGQVGAQFSAAFGSGIITRGANQGFVCNNGKITVDNPTSETDATQAFACNNSTARAKYAFAAGNNNSVSSQGSASFGNGNSTIGSGYSFIAGTQNTELSGGYNFICGSGNTTGGDSTTPQYNLVSGSDNNCKGLYSIMGGSGNSLEELSMATLVMGMTNTVGPTQNSIVFGSSNMLGSNHNNCLVGGNMNSTVANIGEGALIMGSAATNPAQTSNVVIGKSGVPNMGNSFRVTDTAVYGGTYNSTGADYAEMFEWLDGNQNTQDRRGLLVTLEGDKIRLATSADDYILGIVSANPTIVGDSYSEDWQGKYEKDVFGTYVVKDAKNLQELSAEFKKDQQYIPRSDRREWDAIGLMGKLVLTDDGTCVPNKYVASKDNGIGTHSETKTNIRVMKRIDKTHVQVMLK